MTTRRFLSSCFVTILFFGCSGPGNHATGPIDESKSSAAFFLAMEKGDYENAVLILKQEAAKPNPSTTVLYNLGLMYENGRGVRQNFQSAANWYRQAAIRGNADGQYNLAVLYANGTGVKESAADAFSWYLAAAKQGHRSAQYNLGVLYAKGIGVPQSKEQAYMWWDLAASEEGIAKKPAEQHKQNVSAEMTIAQITRARTLVDRCKSSGYQLCR